MMKPGAISIRLAPRSRRATVRGWLQMITPVVRVPAPIRVTANHWLLASVIPLLIGRTIAKLSSAGESTNTNRFPDCSLPRVGLRSM